MKIAVLLSGGVDSSVALSLLSREFPGRVTAFYLKIWLEDELAWIGDCPWEDDLKHARAVCEQLGVPLEIVPLQSEYHARVVEHTISELRAGRTPSPDILCNQRIKFGEFFSKIDDSFDKVASGHYARILEREGVFHLLRAPDPVKDQTYFLSHLNQQQLSRALFPIGHLTKAEVRTLAQELDLPNKDRKDSQGICFLGKIRYPEFVRFHLGNREGEIIEKETGTVLGTHQGYWYYTIGQRQGLGLGNGPWFVVAKDTENNIIYVSHRDNYTANARNELTVAAVNWIAGTPGKNSLQCKLRHGPDLVSCEIAILPDNRVHVRLAQEDTGIAAGQYAIFYDDEECLGGGVIE